MEEDRRDNQEESHFEDLLRSILNGDSIRDFFMRNLKTFMIIGLLVFAYIGNRYACEDVMKRVSETQKQIKEVKYEILCTATELVQLSRQSNIRESLKEKDINLEISTTPPIKIERD